MKYMGSKARIAKYILPIMLKDRKKGQYWVEPFVGGANIIDKVGGNRIGADANKYLISMWSRLQDGWEPPVFISREVYNKCRDQYRNIQDYRYSDAVIGYVGFNGSYNGRFYDGGYAGVIKTKSGKERNYPKEAYLNVTKQLPDVMGVKFITSLYEDLVLPSECTIYCDPPYNGTKQYTCNVDAFKFWQWCRDKVNEGHTVFVSEYNAPDDFECIWQKEIQSGLNVNTTKKGVEKLFVYRG